MLWVASLVLLFQTSLVTVYDAATTYNVTTGVGPFNGSYVVPFLDYLQTLSPSYNHVVLPYSYSGVGYSLVTNPSYSGSSSPINCFGEVCFSYLLTGGLLMVTPWTPLGYEAYPLVKIESVEDLTAPRQMMGMDVPAYRAALGWLLNYTASNIPAASSIVGNFWIAGDQLRYPSTHAYLTQNFQSILAFPFWMFNANNYGNTALQAHDMITTLPPQFYTKASIVAPHGIISFDRDMFYVFIALQGLAMVFVCGTLFWAWFGGVTIPHLSAYPLLDGAFKASTDLEIHHNDATVAGSSEVLELVDGATVIRRRK